jgi:hypothetical protein
VNVRGARVPQDGLAAIGGEEARDLLPGSIGAAAFEVEGEMLRAWQERPTNTPESGAALLFERWYLELAAVAADESR